MYNEDRKGSPSPTLPSPGHGIVSSSSSSSCDEDVRDWDPPKRTPLPWFQFTIVLLLHLAEPMTYELIEPFTPQLIREIGITGGDEKKVGYYVGIMQSLFFAAEAITVMHWSRLSDRIGRKPVILCGLLGLSISMFCFGLSRTFWGLVISRALNGGLNGNIGVLKSVVAEMTDSTNIALAYSYLPLTWALGGTLAPMIGGTLAHPAERFPRLFGNTSFHRDYPYFLACSIPATLAVVAWAVTFVFLDETAPIKRKESLLSTWFSKTKSASTTQFTEASPLLYSPPPNGELEGDTKNQAIPLRKLLTRRVVIAAGNYAVLAWVEITFRAILPLFYSTPIELGGLGLSPPQIGRILSAFGVLCGIVQVFFFAGMQDRWGSKIVFTFGVSLALPGFALYPAMNYLARAQGVTTWVFALVFIQISCYVGLIVAYASIFICISESAPSRTSLGAVNGLAQMTVSIMRAIGPTISTSLFSLSIEGQYLGGWLIYYVMITLVCGAIYFASLLPSRTSRTAACSSM